DRIGHDRTVSEGVRALALKRAWGRWEAEARRRSDLLNAESWDVVRRADQPNSKYRGALEKAERACRLRPGDGNLLNTLGVAQYRNGSYQEALASLTRSNELNKGRLPHDLAFSAMAQHRLGRTDAARETLERLKKVVNDSPDKVTDDVRAFLWEAT